MTRACLIAVAVVFPPAACGNDDQSARDRPSGNVRTNQSAATPAPSTTSSGDEGAIERRLARYFERNFRTAPWYRDIDRFEIKGGRPVAGFEELEKATVVVHTGLAAGERAAAQEICAGVFGADVVDVGGTVRVVTERGRLIRRCLSDL